MAEPLRRQIAQSLQSLLSASEDSTRMTAAGCYGTLCAYMTDSELTDAMEQLMGELRSAVTPLITAGMKTAERACLSDRHLKCLQGRGNTGGWGTLGKHWRLGNIGETLEVGKHWGNTGGSTGAH